MKIRQSMRRAHHEYALRKEMGLTPDEFDRLMEFDSRQLLWMARNGVYEEPERNRSSLIPNKDKRRMRRVRFLREMVRAVKARGWYRWETLSFKD